MIPATRFPEVPLRGRRRALGARLAAWYGENKRDLPWRRVQDPYAIWISEAMLQQTRVETVIDYWKRFLTRFPDVESLAGAELDDVLSLWSGLGYYRRARSLHAAAVQLVEHHGGAMPRTREELLALPGVGPYTAGAVLSIAFDQPEALVDGNIERVFARHFGLDAPADDPAFRRHCWKLAALFIADIESPRIWNQALMELGATVCTPRQPACGDCPLRGSCVALAADQIDGFPRPKRQRASLAVALEILVVRRGERVLLQRRPDAGRMAGLLEFPTREVPAEGAGTLTGLFPATWPLSPVAGTQLVVPAAGDAGWGQFQHAITRHRIRARVIAGRQAPRARLDQRFSWVQLADLGGLALTGMARKAGKRVAAGTGNLLPPE